MDCHRISVQYLTINDEIHLVTLIDDISFVTYS